ncbi:GNAT family N-acetyltransferase [Couchioplanes caeruleus]|uniref:RimJ/RimL family protein N-acetyltransferase n=1 Tax=Couchioplanes caeruleus TaxID=56438 RepID=A0A3N1GQV3_9ACTN|nr:GNAT family protein [Couchioplanes caeruleus]ROP32613.1 RimJ/RimL family protein N-acetyltransferase [Couchioplanes caeruleus]
MEIVTARLALRRPVAADVDAIFDVHHDAEACHHNPSDLLATRTDAEDVFARWDGHWRRHGFGYWVVSAREDGTTLGFCGLKFVRFRDREVLNLFYRLAPAAWGTGVGTEAATAVVRWAGEHLPDWPILARVRPGNVASQKVAQRAGLTRSASLDEPGEDGPDWMYTIRWPAVAPETDHPIAGHRATG